jgi:uncharacterized protein YydD (DUF2326 family)
MITTKQQPQSLTLIKTRNFLREAFIRLCEIRKQIQELQKEEEQIKDWAQYYAEEYLLKGEKQECLKLTDTLSLFQLT